jgi:hypothetical protein
MYITFLKTFYGGGGSLKQGGGRRVRALSEKLLEGEGRGGPVI